MHGWEEELEWTAEFNNNMKLHSIIQKKYVLCMTMLQQLRLKYSSAKSQRLAEADIKRFQRANWVKSIKILSKLMKNCKEYFCDNGDL